jgi:uncharacterized protein (TIGR00725 family)
VIILNPQNGFPRNVIYIAVVGPDDDAEMHDIEAAKKVGYELARRGAALVCGGLFGVMQAACEGVYSYNKEHKSSSQSIGLLPEGDPDQGNRYLTATLPTGLGELRNGLVVRAADAVIAVGCSWGTLSEIALSMRMSKPTILIANHGWELIYRHNQPRGEPLILPSPERAAEEAIKMAESVRKRTCNDAE